MKMILFRQINADIKQGILRRWKTFVLILLIAMVLNGLFLFNQDGLIAKGRIHGSVSLGDALYYMFRGMKEYDPKTGEMFDIVDSYLVWNLMLAFVISSYPVRELKNAGKVYLTRATSRIQWWLSKCVWNMLTVSLFYCCIFAGIFFSGLLCDSIFEHVSFTSLQFNGEIFKRVFRQDLIEGTKNYILLQIFILPYVASLAISGFQMAIEFIINEAVSYIVVIGICGFSAYYMKWFLIGNGMMVYRSTAMNPRGIGILLPILASVALFVISIVVGYLSFRNKDIL
jgi:hypothetical protein